MRSIIAVSCTAMLCLGLVAASSVALAGATIPPLTTVRVASGLSAPIYICSPPNDFARQFIVQQGGRIRILRNGAVLATDFLNISARVAFGGEQGLLGMAFHPNYATNGRFVVYYNPSTAAVRMSEFTVSANPDVANSLSERQIITIPHSGATNHNGGGIQFGADGFLYAGTGDGGGACNQFNTAQSSNSLLGKMIRIDVDTDDFPADPNKNYGIPPSNPFASTTDGILDEIWDFGMRNPWRWSFDRVTHEMWIGDVGQNQIEEIDHEAPGDGGRNYGWACFEGNSGGTCGGQTCNGMPLTFPVQQYTHSSGCAVTGGYVYRGCAIPELRGTYFYSDACTPTLWTFYWNGSSITNFTNRTAELAPGGGLSINSVYSFGEDARGEIYIVDGGGEIFKVVPRTLVDCNSNSVADGCDIAAGTSLDGNSNGVPDECENLCIAGDVNSGIGPVTSVLSVNGSFGDQNGIVSVRIGQPVSVTLGVSPSGPTPAMYTIWVHRNVAQNPQTLVIGADTIGCTLEPSPFNTGVQPQPFRCLRGGFGPEYCSGVFETSPAAPTAPWTRTRGAGFPRTVTFVLQGVLEDSGSGNAAGKSVTNAVTLQITP